MSNINQVQTNKYLNSDSGEFIVKEYEFYMTTMIYSTLMAIFSR